MALAAIQVDGNVLMVKIFRNAEQSRRRSLEVKGPGVLQEFGEPARSELSAPRALKGAQKELRKFATSPHEVMGRRPREALLAMCPVQPLTLQALERLHERTLSLTLLQIGS